MKTIQKYKIESSQPLSGQVSVSGSKNAALPIIAATLLCQGTTELFNVPHLTDIDVMCEILTYLGSCIHSEQDRLVIDNSHLIHNAAPYDLTCKMRGSFLVMGPMLSRVKNVRLSLPGGCPIGTRPVDLHLKGFRQLGAQVEQGYGFVEITCKKLHNAHIYLDFPSVGATENIMMAAVGIDGCTVIENAAAEPEIADLASYLNTIGAAVFGAGTDTVRIFGVRDLYGSRYHIMPDRIEAGSFLLAAAITGGDVTVKRILPEHMNPLLAKLREMGVLVETFYDSVRVRRTDRICAKDIKTLPHPGFPTDMQPQMMSLLAVSEGTGVVTETIFENRFMHVAELCRMGATIKVEGHCAVVEGAEHLSGTKVRATDLRAGAALVLAGLCAKGVTEVYDIYHMDRGYENFEEKLRMLGGNIERVTEYAP